MTRCSLGYLLIVPMLAAVGCQGPDARRQAFTKDLVQLETDAALGRYGEAIAQSSKLLAVATGACEICPVKVALARSQAGLGLNDQALETYRQIAKECADSPLDSSVAMLHLARWVAENDSLNAIPVFKELVRTFPDEPAARQAVTWIKDLMLPNNGQAQTANELMQFANEIRPDGQAKANVLYTAAELLVATDPDSQLALDLYDQIITDFPAHGLSNDAMMAKAHLLINLDRPAEAVKVLEALLGRRQWSFLIGSYEVDLYKKASEMLPEVAAKAGESPKEIERRQREHHRRYSQ